MSDMNVSAVSSAASSAAASYTSSAKTQESTQTASTASSSDAINGVSAVYEASEQTETTETTKSTYSNPTLVAQLKADSEARTQQLQDIVNKLLTQQGQAYNTANGLKSLYENLVVDDATRAQAQADIAEDGYYGVEQTSSRILDFAEALCGGDPDKMEEMRAAFEKGYKQAAKTWGGELPQICQDTYDAVLKKFDEYKANSTETEG